MPLSVRESSLPLIRIGDFFRPMHPRPKSPISTIPRGAYLNVPHDWSIEGPFDEKNPTGGAGGFLPAGVGWYRKHFTLPADYAGRRVFIEFDGVMANSDVWINGQHLGKRPYGYVSFRYELTGKLNFGENKPNILAVRADNSAQPASRWYSGAGIYRHVRLIATDPVHIDQWGTFVTTPKIESDQAVVRVQTTVVNQSDAPHEVSLKISIVAPDDKTVQTSETAPQTIPAGKSAEFQAGHHGQQSASSGTWTIRCFTMPM